jgi:dTDP-4-amino-4,6-dideoxygalactose transaminase
LIPFNVPFVPEISKNYAIQALTSAHQQGDGPFCLESTKLLSKMVGNSDVLLTGSCTHALEIASLLINLGPEDEVILPSYNFTSAATAIINYGATPVFVDVSTTNLAISTELIENAITPKTKAISWVNYAGLTPNIEDLLRIKEQHGLVLIEDNAHGLGGTYKNKALGTFGDFSTLSFHATKNIQCGEGGALVINNKDYLQRAEIIREKGTNRKEFQSGIVEKYKWVDKGSSYLMNEVTSAVLLGQLENFEQIQNARLKIWNLYFSFMTQFQNKYEIIEVDATNNSNIAHIFYFLANSKIERDKLILEFNKAGIQATSHYESLHNSPAGLRYGVSRGEISNSVDVSSRIIRLPVWVGINETQLSLQLNELAEKLDE